MLNLCVNQAPAAMLDRNNKGRLSVKRPLKNYFA